MCGCKCCLVSRLFSSQAGVLTGKRTGLPTCKQLATNIQGFPTCFVSIAWSARLADTQAACNQHATNMQAGLPTCHQQATSMLPTLQLD
eukprot:1157441-Pelagomonas_calceolata.AAC.1